MKVPMNGGVAAMVVVVLVCVLGLVRITSLARAYPDRRRELVAPAGLLLACLGLESLVFPLTQGLAGVDWQRAVVVTWLVAIVVGLAWMAHEASRKEGGHDGRER